MNRHYLAPNLGTPRRAVEAGNAGCMVMRWSGLWAARRGPGCSSSSSLSSGLRGISQQIQRCRSSRPEAAGSAPPLSSPAAAALAEKRRQRAAPQSKSVGLSAELHQYLVGFGCRSTPELSALLAATCELGPVARNVSPPDTVSLLQMLIRLTKAEHVIEIGVFTGFTTLGMALARERPLGSQP